MSLKIEDIVVGGVYKTANNQERRVLDIKDGKVYYESRGGNVKNKWEQGHNSTNPPSLEKFAEAVVEKI